jgi:Putative regulator of cell autolysis
MKIEGNFMRKRFEQIIKYIILYFQKSIKNKMIILISISMVIPMAIITILSYISSSNSMEKEIIRSNNRAMEWTGKYIDNTISQLNDVLFTFVVDKDIYLNINKTYDINNTIQYNSQKYISDKMYSILYSNNNYNGLILFNENKKQLFYVSPEVSNCISNYPPKNEEWYEVSKNTFGGTFVNNERFLPSNLRFYNKQNDKSFYMIRSLRQFENNDFIGVVLLNVKWSVMNDIINILKTEEKSDIFITDIDGNIAYDPYNSKIEKSELSNIVDLIKKDTVNGNTYIKTSKYSVFYYRFAKDSMMAIKIIPNSLIVESARNTLGINILIIIVFLIISVFIAIAIAYETTKPIIKLSKSMKGIKDNQLISVTPTGRLDEIGVLEQSYHFMVEKIKYLIENEYKINMEKRTAQLRALQAQINPHFLNNTLQLIGGIAISKNAPEIYTIIKAIGNMFFYSIKDEEDLVDLDKEIHHIKDYLFIQELRFTDRIDIEFNIDENLSKYALPKLIIQPLVENAFRHGLEKKAGLWKLSISTLKNENKINIIVEDNGVGIDEVKLKSINRQLEDNLNNVLHIGGSMGVKNIDARIKLYFGSEYGINIKSSLNNGTKITLIFPALLKGEIR